MTSDALDPVSGRRHAWPLIVVETLAIGGAAFGWRSTWSADLAALLTAFAIPRIGMAILACLPALSRPPVRWIVLAGIAALAVATATMLQGWLWPPARLHHASWLVPIAASAFALLALLPDEIEYETARRSSQALAEEQKRHKVERQILEARLAALQGQIEPHFLYNTLANTRALVRQDAHAAETMLTHLIAYLRAAMPDLRSNVTTLGQELARARAFLDITRIRFGERLNFTIEASPDAEACLIPPLAVMTLVENALKHGIEPQVQGGNIVIRAGCEDGRLVVEVSDDGAGFRAESGSGVGLVNLQERLQALFGPEAELSVQPGPRSGVVACFAIAAAPQAAIA